MRDLRQSASYSNYLKSLNWEIINKKSQYVFIKKLPLIGYFVKIQRPEKLDFNLLDSILLQKRIFNIIIEPKSKSDAQLLIKNGFKLSSSPYLPTKSIINNIQSSTTSIFNSFKKDARYCVKKSSGIKVTEAKDLQKFRNFWTKATNNKRYIIPLNQLQSLKRNFGKNSIFFLSEEGHSGGLFLISDKTCYYWIGFTDKTGRKALHQYQLIWKAILWAKKMKCHYFDFEGIFDERFPKKEWVGFTHFKKSFGGKEIEYPGCFVKWRLPI